MAADRWAAEQTDALCLAEALLLVVEQSPLFSDNICAAVSRMTAPNRLTQRIEALLTAFEPTDSAPFFKGAWGAWSWVLLSALPLLAIPLHF